MGLDIYVMPLWRFKVGDFHSAIEVATGIRPKIVTADGIIEHPAAVTWRAWWQAKREISAIRKTVGLANNSRIRWRDRGDVVLAERSQGFESLRAYAKWLDCKRQLPDFGWPPDGNFYSHPAWGVDIDKLSCPHLVNNDCYNGYFLPCDFATTVEVEPFLMHGRQPALRSVGSSVRLRHELDIVTRHLPSAAADAHGESTDPLSAVLVAHAQLQRAAELSCQSGLPIEFWG